MNFVRLCRCLPRLNGAGKLAKMSTAVEQQRVEITMPTSDGATKNYSPKIHTIVDEISKLTLLQVSELNELLKIRLKIPDAPLVGYGVAAAPTQSGQKEKEEKVVKSNYTVKLVKFDTSKKVQLIKEMKNLVEGMNLVQAKKFIENLPQIVRADVSEKESKELAEAIKNAGGECEIE
uniref:39S ribosomal protein L12, mitochondrial n=1 Tax=Strigamia maritima TaxID=126957 RepID=T1J1G6_STRMM